VGDEGQRKTILALKKAGQGSDDEREYGYGDGGNDNPREHAEKAGARVER